MEQHSESIIFKYINEQTIAGEVQKNREGQRNREKKIIIS